MTSIICMKSNVDAASEALHQFVTALHTKDVDTVHMLLQTQDLDRTMASLDADSSALTYIIHNEDWILDQVLDWFKNTKKLDVNKKDQHGNYPIHEAVKYGSIKAVSALVEHGADVTVPNARGLAPLHIAATTGNDEIVTALLESVTEKELHKFINQDDPWGNTALMRAAAYNQTKCAQILVEKGADLEMKNKDEFSALQFALLTGNATLSQSLYEAGCQFKCNLSPLPDRFKIPTVTQIKPKGKLRKLRNRLRSSFRRVTMKKQEKMLNSVPPMQLLLSCHPELYEAMLNSSKNPAEFRQRGLEYLFNLVTWITNFPFENMVNIITSCGLYVVPIRTLDRELILKAAQYHIESGAEVDGIIQKLSIRSADLCHHRDRKWLYKEDYREILQLCLRACSFASSSWSVTSLLTIHFNAVDHHQTDRVKPILFSSSHFYNLLYPISDSVCEGAKVAPPDVRNPRSLQDCCRITIRQNLKRNVVYSAKSLPLPSAMKDFVTVCPDDQN